MRKELVNLMPEAMEQHQLPRDFYHRLAQEPGGDVGAVQPVCA